MSGRKPPSPLTITKPETPGHEWDIDIAATAKCISAAFLILGREPFFGLICLVRVNLGSMLLLCRRRTMPPFLSSNPEKAIECLRSPQFLACSIMESRFTLLG